MNVLSQTVLRAVSVGGLHGPPYVILPPPHTSCQKKKEINKRKPLGWAVVPLAFLLGESRGGRDQDKLQGPEKALCVYDHTIWKQ